MADRNDPFNVVAVWSHLAEANLRYYSSYARLVREYVDEAIGSFQGDRTLSTSGAFGAVSNGPREGLAARQAPPPPAMALEGKLDTRPVGAFVIENVLSRQVRAPVLVSSFKAPDGVIKVSVALTFEPDEINLRPGEQLLVRVTAAIDESLEPGLMYRADVTVPGLETRMGLIVRREPEGRAPRTLSQHKPGG